MVSLQVLYHRRPGVDGNNLRYPKKGKKERKRRYVYEKYLIETHRAHTRVQSNTVNPKTNYLLTNNLPIKFLYKPRKLNVGQRKK